MATKKASAEGRVRVGKTLKDFPRLLEQWHPTRNGNIDPHNLVAGTHKSAWWKCPMGPDHEWEAVIRSRAFEGQGCPFCQGRRLSVTNRLDIVAPFFLAEWDYERNGDLTPDKIIYSSKKPVWWSCPKGPEHIWRRTPQSRLLSDSSCPFCLNMRISVTNSLATCLPELAKQWHPTKNGDLTPADVVAGAAKRIWWQCPNHVEHVWQAPIARRARGAGCPYCVSHSLSRTNSLATLEPAVAREWHPTKNGRLTPADVISRSSKRVWWQCPKFAEHEWNSQVSKRAVGHGCPFCATHSKRVCSTNSLATLAPYLVAEWHPTKNGALRPTDVTYGASLLKVWWKCPKGPDHEWQVHVASRTSKRRSGCPFCKMRRVCSTNSLAVLCPRVAAEWHPTKNGDLTAAQVVPGSTRRVYWRCVMGHDWSSSIYDRATRDRRCPYCPRRKRKVVTKRKPRETVYMPTYEGPRATPAGPKKN
jgi:hypothetical protein